VAPSPPDLVVTQSVLPPLLHEGDSTTLTFVVTNRGTGAATSVILDAQLGSALVPVSVQASQGTCSGATHVTCTLGTLAGGTSATVTIVARGPQAGALVEPFATVATAHADEADAHPEDDSATATVKVALRPQAEPPVLPPPAPLLPPQQAGFFDVQPVTGTVLVNGAVLVAPDQLPATSTIDARGGSVEIISGGGRAVFYGGVFKVVLPSMPGAVTQIVLQTVVPKTVCAPAAHRARKPATIARPKILGLLWGSGAGRFRTVGRYSAATVRGTTWLVAERCDGTFTYVRIGRVDVLDKVRKKTLLLADGHSYLAKPAAPKAQRK
jgi:hypothetical protein